MNKVQLDQSKLLGFKVLPPMPKIGQKIQKKSRIKLGGKIGVKIVRKVNT